MSTSIYRPMSFGKFETDKEYVIHMPHYLRIPIMLTSISIGGFNFL